MGAPITRPPPKSPQEAIQETFSARLQLALALADRVPEVISHDRLMIQQLYTEMRKCTLFGLNGAAITLCGILLEFTLKYVCYHWDIDESETAFDPVLWDTMVEKTYFSGAITIAERKSTLGRPAVPFSSIKQNLG